VSLTSIIIVLATTVNI